MRQHDYHPPLPTPKQLHWTNLRPLHLYGNFYVENTCHHPATPQTDPPFTQHADRHLRNPYQQSQLCPQAHHHNNAGVPDLNTENLPQPCEPRYQLRNRAVHLINCILREEHMPTCQMKYNIRQHTRGYDMAANMLELTERAHATHQAFIGAIIDNSTRQMLEYRHLIKMANYKAIWHTSFANKLGRLAPL